MNAVDQFATEAAIFEQWARSGTSQGALALREALIRLARLYLAALELPRAWSDEVADQPDAERIDKEECFAVASNCRRFPSDFYWQMRDPFGDPPEEPEGRSLMDDVTDVYRDVVTGLREYQAGRRAVALWEWGFGFQRHWGEHATSAIRALHCWLAANAPERLETDSKGP